MGKKMYEIGLCVKASEHEFDFETVEWDDDLESVTEARKRAKELSKKCPFKYYNYQSPIEAIQITCHSDEEEVSSYYLHWCETYVNGKMVRRINY